MKVLVVSPNLQEPVPFADEEIQAIINSGISTRLRRGQITPQEIRKDVWEFRPKILWLTTHGSDEGVLISDSTLWTANEIIADLRGTEVELLYLNSCYSIGFATSIVDHLDVSVICTLSPDGITGDRAMNMGARFIESLSQLNDVQLAYNRAKPANNKDFLYLSHPKEYGKTAYINRKGRMDDITLEVARLKSLILGTEGAEQYSIQNRLTRLEEKANEHTGQLAEIKNLLYLVGAITSILITVTALAVTLLG